jgi:16S rRNA processing protein RimM
VNYLKIGFIKKPHGLKGEIKILPLTDNIERFRKLKKVFLQVNDQFLENEIQHIKITPDEIILKLKEYNDVSEVDGLKNKYVFIDRKDAIPCNEWEFYSQDLIDCQVLHNKESIGTVIDVLNTGANDNLLILSNGVEIFYPFIREYIESIDIKNKIINILQTEGFFD